MQVLILNKSFSPIGIISFKKAIVLLFKEKAKVLEVGSYYTYDWKEWINKSFDGYKRIKTPKQELCVPEIIVLKEYDKIQKKKLNANKKNIYKRDMGQCQYCAKALSVKDATIDHINPKSKNGKFTWDNCVLSCVKCNLKKGNYDLKEIGMKLLKKPEAPSHENISFCFIENAPESWKLFKLKVIF